MTNEKQRTVSIPRWHYRNTQAEVQSILESANSIGSLRGAMVDYIHKRQDKLPEGVTAESAVDSIVKAADGFAAANAEGRTADDIKNALKEAIREMEPQQAVAYLAALEAVCRSCDSAAIGGDVPSIETLRGELTDAAKNASEEEIAGRIDKLAETILGDSLKSYVYASGNSELAELIRSQASIASNGVSSDTASRIHDMLLDDSRKAGLYAATACACYGMVLDGKVEGISAANLDAGVMTALVAAGLEKASILTRLARGEIDRELATDMLSALARTLKWMLVKALQGVVIWTTTDVMIWTLTGIFTGWPLVVVGLFFGIFTALECKEPLERVVDYLDKLAKSAVKYICNAISWCWEKGKEIAVGINFQHNTQRETQVSAKMTY